jgi:hypothetical protein
MADLTISAPEDVSLTTVAGGELRRVTAGETITQGKSVYRKSTDDNWYLSNAATSVDTAKAGGIAMTPATVGEDFMLAERSVTIDLGVNLVLGETYIASNTNGGVAPIGDWASGWYKTILGTATATRQLLLDPKATGVAKA